MYFEYVFLRDKLRCHEITPRTVRVFCTYNRPTFRSLCSVRYCEYVELRDVTVGTEIRCVQNKADTGCPRSAVSTRETQIKVNCVVCVFCCRDCAQATLALIHETAFVSKIIRFLNHFSSLQPQILGIRKCGVFVTALL